MERLNINPKDLLTANYLHFKIEVFPTIKNGNTQKTYEYTVTDLSPELIDEERIVDICDFALDTIADCIEDAIHKLSNYDL